MLGLASQGIKICVDTLVQTGVDDAFRGRVFSLYDVIFNVAFVAAAAVGAAVLPADGKSYAVLGASRSATLVTALFYARVTRQPSPAPAPVPSRLTPDSVRQRYDTERSTYQCRRVVQRGSASVSAEACQASRASRAAS